MNIFNDAFKTIGKIFNKDKSESNNTLLEEKMSIEDLITTKQYPLEIHNVETTDGYILRVFRITGPKGDLSHLNINKPSVLFQHGLLDSSDGWVCNSEENCLPYLFANTGHDVWLSNSRGNKHSKLHKKFSATTYEFWSFSFHEMGLYDVPAVIEHIQNNNKSREKIIYVGHSQGTCMLFSALTMNFEYYKSKIKLFIALAPVARVGNLKSSFLKTLESLKFHKILKAANQYEVFPDNDTNTEFNFFMNKHFSQLTHLVVDMISDSNSKLNNNKQLGVYLTHYPAGTSFKAIYHFMQNFRSKKFCHYDYKKDANIFIYGQITPLEYDLSVIKDFPIMLLAGKEDKLASIEDVRWLKNELGSNVIYYQEYENMGHITFLMGKNIMWFLDAFEQVIKFKKSEIACKTDDSYNDSESEPI